MRQPERPPQRIAVAYHPRIAGAQEEAARVARFVGQLGFSGCDPVSLYDAGLHAQIDAAALDLLIALGGDGTMLRAGHLCSRVGLPVLGINVGRFGFLTELRPGEWEQALPLLLEKRYWLEERMTLTAEHWRGEQRIDRWDVLNEVVVTRGAVVRPIRVRAEVDGHPLATYVADGLIVSTATGSTAYALAAGGPILPPELRNLLLIAVAPHLSVDRAVILPEGARVAMHPFTDHQAVYSVDGQAALPLQDGDAVHVSAGEHPVFFVRFQDSGYFYRTLTAYMEQNPSARGTR